MSIINSQYSQEVNRIMSQKEYSRDDLQKMKAEGVSTEELKQLKAKGKYCYTNQFKRVQANQSSLIKQHLRLALKIAKHYWTVSGIRNVPLDDVVQAANMGLTIAANKFTEAVVPEEYKNVKFSTYAYNWIKKYVLDELNLTSQQLTTGTRAAYEQRTKDHRYYSKDAQFEDFDENPIANEMVSTLKDGEAIIEFEENQKQATFLMSKMLKKLDSQERTVISALFGIYPFDNPLTNKELSKKFGLTPSTISNTYKRALHKLYWSISENERKAFIEASLSAGMDMRQAMCG